MKRQSASIASSGAWYRPDDTDADSVRRRREGEEAKGLQRRKQAITYTVTGSYVVPTFLVFVCPVFAMVFIRLLVDYEGDLGRFIRDTRDMGSLLMLKTSVWPYVLGSRKACEFIVPFAAFQLLLMRVVPGKVTKGPVTPAGNIPVYKANGLLSFFITIAAFGVGGYVLKIFDPAEVYDHFQEIIGTLNLFSLLFCLFLSLKGRFVPSSTDSGASGNLIFDYFWGTELYPRVFGWDIKVFTNCRFGLMSWGLLLLCYATKQYQLGSLSDSMVAAVTLQLVYITKFFHWEMGYMKSLDIMHDRAGFMLVRRTGLN